MIRIKLIFISSLIIALTHLTGCTITPQVGEIPATEKDFLVPYDKLVIQYPAIASNRMSQPPSATDEQIYANSVGLHIPLQLLENKWGEPDTINNGSWLLHIAGILTAQLAGYALAGAPPIPMEVHIGIFGGFYAYYPFPPQTYIWLKGEYCIRARTVRNGDTIYRGEVVEWTWMDKNNCVKNTTHSS